MSINYDNVKKIRQITQLTYSDSYNLLQVHNYNLEDALYTIEYFNKYILGEVEINEDINEKLVKADVYRKLKNKIKGIEEPPQKINYTFSTKDLNTHTESKKKGKLIQKTKGAIVATTTVVAGVALGSGYIAYKLMTNKSKKAREISEKTGLTREESMELLNKYNGNVELAISEFNNKPKNKVVTILSKSKIKENVEKCKEYSNLGKNLSEYNTMRGGKKGFKGYVFEELHATDATINGQKTKVIANNGIADFKIIGENGKVINGQAKIGYRTKSINWNNYKNQTIVVDKGNKQLLARAKKAGRDVIESNVSEKQAKSLANKMQIESNITGKKNSFIVPRVYSNNQIIKQCHKAGISSVKNGTLFGGGYSIGCNIISVADGDKDVKEATVDIAKDAAVAGGVAYATGVATTAIASTSIGTSVIGAASAATSAIASTSAGAAVVGTIGAVATTASSVPVVVTGVGVGIGCSIGKKLLEKYNDEDK